VVALRVIIAARNVVASESPGFFAFGCSSPEATVDAAADTPPNADAFIVDVTTSKGEFAIEVNPSWAPNGLPPPDSEAQASPRAVVG
jgi:hypothetical protein